MRRGGHRPSVRFGERPDRLRVVLDGVRDLGVRARGGHQRHQQSGHVHDRQAVSRPPDGERVQQPAGAVANGGRDLDHHLGDRAGAEAEHERGEAGVEGRGADPGAEHRGRARQQAEQREPAEARPGLLRHRAPRSPAPRWCCAARSRRRAWRRAPATRSRRPIRSQAPPPGCAGRCRAPPGTRPGSRRLRARRPRLAIRRRAVRAASVHPREREVGARRAQPDERGAPERLRALAGDLRALEQRVHAEEGEQADGERQQEPDPARVDAADPGQPEHPDGHRDHPHVDADQRHQAVEAEVGLGRLDRRLDRVVDRAAGGGEQQRPRRPRPRSTGSRTSTSAPPSRSTRPPSGRTRRRRRSRSPALTATGSGPSLRTCSSISPGRSTVRSTARSSTGTPFRSSPGASSATNRPIAAASSTSGTSPASQAGRRVPLCGGRLHQSSTSKNPIHPSSANSQTCAWNMYLPGTGSAARGSRAGPGPGSPCP